MKTLLVGCISGEVVDVSFEFRLVFDSVIIEFVNAFVQLLLSELMNNTMS